jgi:dUTP pyrophosphatase
MILEYVRVREGAIPPQRANPSDAGLDVFFNPKDGTEVITLEPGESALFSTGLRFGVPHGYMLQVMNRSSMAAKRGLVVGAHCVDSGYDGEVFIDLHNISNITQHVPASEKIAQIVLVPVVPFRALETKNGNLYDWYPITISDRGEGSLGSTGK